MRCAVANVLLVKDQCQRTGELPAQLLPAEEAGDDDADVAEAKQQAAGLGVVLVLVSAWLHHGYYHKRSRGAVVRAGGSVAERKSTDLFAPTPVNSENSTASASVALGVEAESKV